MISVSGIGGPRELRQEIEKSRIAKRKSKNPVWTARANPRNPKISKKIHAKAKKSNKMQKNPKPHEK